MKYNREKHHRRSLRLKGYDYSGPGAYFITICTQDRECLFGEIVDGEMILNDAGEIIKKWWLECSRKFINVENKIFQIMPNHFHGIIIIVGADLCVCPDRVDTKKGAHAGAPLPDRVVMKKGAHAGAPLPDRVVMKKGAHAGAPLPDRVVMKKGAHAGAPLPDRVIMKKGAHAGAPLHRIIQWFKTMTTNEYLRNIKTHGWPRLNGKLWQRNYFERVIRNENELNQIRQYILNNPLKWDLDSENPVNR